MLLLIPGPVMTRPEVKAAMTVDFAPWDRDFYPLLAGVRARVAAIANAPVETHMALPLQGCGHFATEAMIRSFIPAGGRLLVPMTGSYAERMVRLAREAGRAPLPLEVPRDRPLDPQAIAAALAADPAIGHVGFVYSETATGIVSDPAALGAVVRAAGRRVLLDAVSAFGALPIDMAAQPEIDALVFTSGKCLEGMPGLGFAVARMDRLEACAGQAGSWSFDLSDILAQARRSGQGSFRFTPPAQVINALRVALDLYDAEGGQPARLARYRANAAALRKGVLGLGLRPVLDEAAQGPIVFNVHAPADPRWNLQDFVDALKRRGVLISNFYNTPFPSFRVGTIGAITPADIARACAAMGEALAELGIARKAA